MTDQSYNTGTNSTAVPPRASGGPRQFVRASVFIDGNNWYHRLKELLNNTIHEEKHSIKPPIRYDVRALCESVVAPAQLAGIHFFQGTIKQIQGNEHNALLYANQRRRFQFLQKQGVQLGFGTVIMHPDGIFHEKGVDLRLAISMFKGALADTYDVAYLISSDNDMVPAIEECRDLGKEVVHVGSSLKPSFGLQKASSRSVLLEQKDVLPFLPPQQSLLPNITT